MKWVFLCIYLALFPSFGYTVHILFKEQERIPVEGRLTDAYSTFDRCGTKGRYSCEVFRGRYYLKEQKFLVDKDISGFVYKDFVKYGPSNQTVEISRMTLEGRRSMWWFTYAMVSGFMIFFGPLFYCLRESETGGKGGGFAGPINPAAYFL